MKQIYICLLLIFVFGCASYSEYYKLDDKYLERRQRETRFFETTDENKMLSSSVQLLQDSGFILTEINENLGLITGAKDRTAGSIGQEVAAIALAALLGVQPVYEVSQKINVTIVLTKKNHGCNVRVEFARIVYFNNGRVGVETINDEETYSVFFNNLSQSIFLTAHEL